MAGEDSRSSGGWVKGRIALAAALAALTVGGAAALTQRETITAQPIPSTSTPVPTRTSDTPSPSWARTAQPVIVVQTVPPVTLIAPTPTAQPYRLVEVTPGVGLGVSRLFLIDPTSLVPPEPVSPQDLRLPTPALRPDTGRFGEIRYRARLTHLGSDYLNPSNLPMIPPAENAVLVAAMHLQANTFAAIAVDMSGDVQMYWVTLQMEDGPKQYLFCFAHLQDGSNVEAMRQAAEHGGRVEAMGRVSTMSHDDGNLSDMHIAAIDVDRLLALTGESNLSAALAALFSGTVPRTGQQYPELFVRPEDVFPALEYNLLTRAYP